jgi:hypothetical protein
MTQTRKRCQDPEKVSDPEKMSGTYCGMVDGLGLAPTIALGADLRKIPDNFV